MPFLTTLQCDFNSALPGHYNQNQPIEYWASNPEEVFAPLTYIDKSAAKQIRSDHALRPYVIEGHHIQAKALRKKYPEYSWLCDIFEEDIKKLKSPPKNTYDVLFQELTLREIAEVSRKTTQHESGALIASGYILYIDNENLKRFDLFWKNLSHDRRAEGLEAEFRYFQEGLAVLFSEESANLLATIISEIMPEALIADTTVHKQQEVSPCLT